MKSLKLRTIFMWILIVINVVMLSFPLFDIFDYSYGGAGGELFDKSSLLMSVVMIIAVAVISVFHAKLAFGAKKKAAEGDLEGAARDAETLITRVLFIAMTTAFVTVSGIFGMVFMWDMLENAFAAILVNLAFGTWIAFLVCTRNLKNDLERNRIVSNQQKMIYNATLENGYGSMQQANGYVDIQVQMQNYGPGYEDSYTQVNPQASYQAPYQAPMQAPYQQPQFSYANQYMAQNNNYQVPIQQGQPMQQPMLQPMQPMQQAPIQPSAPTPAPFEKASVSTSANAANAAQAAPQVPQASAVDWSYKDGADIASGDGLWDL